MDRDKLHWRAPASDRVRRRGFLSSLGVATMLPALAQGQQSPKTKPFVGALYIGEPSASMSVSARDAFLKGLRENGYVEGQNIAIEQRYASDPVAIAKAAQELVGLHVDVIMAIGTQAALAVKRATSSIPIVNPNMADPVADGLVSSLSRPGGNVTGNTFLGAELGSKRLQLLRELVPLVTSFGGLQHPGVFSEQTMQTMAADMRDAAKAAGAEFRMFDAKIPDEFDSAFEAIGKTDVAALLVLPSPMFYVNHRRLIDLAALHRLPTIYWFREAVQAGGLISYGADIPDNTRRAATYVARILKGAKPGELPVEQPTKFELLVNLRTAKALGLTIPPSILARADEVIE